jgi:hypothetical protein
MILSSLFCGLLAVKRVRAASRYRKAGARQLHMPRRKNESLARGLQL